MERFTIKSGNTAPALTVQLTDDLDQPASIIGGTVRMLMRPLSGGPAVIDAAASIIDPAIGIVSYQWVAGQTDVVGEYDVSFVVTFGDGTEQTFPGDGYISVEIEPSLDSELAPTIPALPDYCWPVDVGCCSDFDNYAPAVQNRAKALAASSLRLLTGSVVGGCPITVRPCKRSCVSDYHNYYVSGTWMPYSYNGTWVNYGCGCTYESCSCSALEQISLPPPIGSVSSVKVDGAVLPSTDYRVDNQRWLVRTDGGTWPTCQALEKPDTEPGTFSVTYLNAQPVDGLGAYAAGVLACEFAKACSGSSCRLPAGVTEITRSGVSFTVPTGAFTDGLTGIREVDAYITTINPNRLRQPVRVWTPDRAETRTTTWP